MTGAGEAHFLWRWEIGKWPFAPEPKFNTLPRRLLDGASEARKKAAPLPVRPKAETIEILNDRRCIKSQKLAHDQPANDCYAKRAAHLASLAKVQGVPARPEDPKLRPAFRLERGHVGGWFPCLSG
jgi:hypothetical protein